VKYFWLPQAGLNGWSQLAIWTWGGASGLPMVARPMRKPSWYKLLVAALLSISTLFTTPGARPTLAAEPAAVAADPAADLVAAGGPLQLVQKYVGLGAVTARLVGPGPVAGSQRLYVSYIYYYDTFEIVAFDPDTGAQQVYPSPVASEWGAWALATGPDGNIYVGTLPHAHLLKLDPRTGSFTDLGQPSPSEEYIWGLTFGSDGKLYGGTYPSAKLVRFDPASGASADLGRMDPTEMYVRPVMASTDGFIYGAIGFGKAHLVAYEIATGQHRDILPADYQVEGGLPVMHRGVDGRIFADVNGRYLRLDGWKATPIQQSAVSMEDAGTILRDGLVAWIESGEQTLTLRNQISGAIVKQVPVAYAGRPAPIFRLSSAPDGQIYGSTIMPLHLFRIDRATSNLKDMGVHGTGECYTFLPYGQQLLMGTYFGGGGSPLMVFDPRTAAPPRPVQYAEQQNDWRPEAMIMGPNNEVLVGARAGYGRLGGPLTVWHPDTDKIETYKNVVQDQDVVSLATKGGLVVGGTTTIGGSGAHGTQTDAKLFVWDPTTRQKIFETVPVSGASKITDLVVGPNGLVYGFADRTLFVFDLDARSVVSVSPQQLESTPIYNSIGLGPDGRLWGVAETGVFVVDPATGSVRVVGPSPEKVTAGFVLDGRDLYFAAQSKVYRYRLTDAGL
jgi:streptogramin lyase